jgi:hypothetical protein
MKRLFKKSSVALTALSMALTPIGVGAQDTEVELVSYGGGNTYRLPDDVSQVDLVQQTRGNCRFGRSWGYDLSAKELWVDSGCGGRFKVTRAAPSSQGGGSNAGYAVAAVAAIAGLALLANHNSQNNDQGQGNGNGNHRPGGQPGWQPGGQSGSPFRSVGGLCLDVDKAGGSIHPGSAVQIWACNGQWNQSFTWARNGEIRVGNMCLDVENANPNDGGRLIVWQCSGAANQRWRARGRDIVSDLNGKCMAVWEGQARNGQRVVTWGCNGSTNQNWWW